MSTNQRSGAVLQTQRSGAVLVDSALQQDRGIIVPAAPSSDADEDPDLNNEVLYNKPLDPKGLQPTGAGFWLGVAALGGLAFVLFGKPKKRRKTRR